MFLFLSISYKKTRFCLGHVLGSESHISAHHEVELLRLLLVGPPLCDAGFAEVRLRHGGLDRFGGAAVVETLGYVVVFDGHHVLDGGESGLGGLLDLQTQGAGGLDVGTAAGI